MKKLVIYCSVLYLSTVFVHAQFPTFEWAGKIGGTGTDWASSVITDNSGNIYLSGQFENTADLDPTFLVNNVTSVGAGDMFIEKLNPNGDLLWVHTFGSPGIWDRPLSLEIDINGNLYMTGTFQGTIDFDPGIGVSNLTAIGFYDSFILKLDQTGSFKWVKHLASNGGVCNSSSMKIDASNNIILTGEFDGTTDFDPGIGVSNITAIGSQTDGFVLKLDTLGGFLWVKVFEGLSRVTPQDVAVDQSNNIFINGNYNLMVDFDPGVGVFNFTSNAGESAFTVKLSSNGDFQWATTLNGTGSEASHSLDVDPFGNIYSIGMFKGSIDIDPGPALDMLTSVSGEDIFVQKLDANGNLLWGYSFGENFNDRGYGIKTDSNGDVYLTGYFEESSSPDFDPGSGFAFAPGSNNLNIFILKLNKLGGYEWVYSIAGPGAEYAWRPTIDQFGSLFIIGSFEATVDFDITLGSFTHTSAGMGDAFIMKLGSSVNVEKYTDYNQIKVYPNPAEDNLYLDIEKNKVERVEITDISGKLIETPFDLLDKSINISSLTNGLYILKVVSEGKNLSSLFVKGK